MPNVARARERITSQVLNDTCTIANVDDYTGTLNTTTGELTADTSTAVYSGACYVFAPLDYPASADVGGQQLSRLHYRLHLPWSGTEDVVPGQTVTVTGSADSSLVGRTFQILRVRDGSGQVSRRCDMEDRVDAARTQ